MTLPPRDAVPRRAGFALLLAAAALSLACWNPGFVFDDLDLLAHAAAGGVWGWLGPDAYGLWRPVKSLLFTLVTAAPGFHRELGALFSALAAVFMTWAALRFVRRLPGPPLAGVLAVALFLLSPTLISTLGWFSCANIALMAGFAFLTLEACVDERPRAGLRIGGFAFAALLSYEGAIALPALAALTALALRNPMKGPLFGTGVAAVAFLALRFASGAKGAMAGECIDPGITGGQLSLMSGWLALDHLWSWALPWGRQTLFACLAQDDLQPVRVAIGWMVLLGMVGAGFALRERHPLPALGLVWFPVAFAPMSNLLPLRSGPVADYFLTLPSFGLALLLASAAATFWSKPPPGRFAAIVLLLVRLAAVPACLTWAAGWRNENLLLERCMKNRPGSWKIELAYARALADRDPAAAARLASAAGVRAPWAGEVPVVLAHVALRRGDAEAAVRHARAAAVARPSDPYPLIVEAFATPDAAAQEKLYRKALSLPWTQSSPDAVLNLAALLGSSARAEEGWTLLNANLHRMPPTPELYANLAATAAARGDRENTQRYTARYRALSGRSATP